MLFFLAVQRRQGVHGNLYKGTAYPCKYHLATVFNHKLTKRDVNLLSTISLLQLANLNHQPTIERPLSYYSSNLNQLLVTNRMGNSPLLKRDMNQLPIKLGTPIQTRSFESATLFKIKLVASQSVKDAKTSIFYSPSSEFCPHPGYLSSKLKRT